MKTPKELLPKPSDALTAMIDGLETVTCRDDFEVDMATYGYERDGMCFGCAATCTVLELFPEAPVGHLARRDELGQGWFKFESVIDDVRCACWDALEYFYGVMLPAPAIALPTLETDDWREGIEAYVSYRDQLVREGL